MNNERTPRIGVDIGRVLIDGGPRGGSDSSFLDGSLEVAIATPPCDGAIEGLATLVELFGSEHTWLVSKAGSRVADRSRRWLDAHDVYARTRLRETHLVFVRERTDKAREAARLELTHFVDDRLDVLHHLAGLVPERFVYGEQAARAPAGVEPCPSWIDVTRRVRASLR
jgi:hypothetical protein